MIVDYLTYTFAQENEENLPELVKEIDRGAVQLEAKHGYTSDWCLWGKGRLKWGHVGDVLARLSLPGSALALYREGGGDIGPLVIAIGEAGGRCTRVDFAFDWDIEASRVIERVRESIEAGHYTSRWRLKNPRSCTRTSSILGDGDTLYLGSPSSDTRLRIYDKAAEQGEDEPRLRVELQMRKERADAAVVLLTVGADEAVDYVKSLILGYFDIKEPVEGDSNKSRWPTADWWAAMWGEQKGHLSMGSGITTEEESREWLERLGASIAVHMKLNGGDVDWLLKAIREGSQPAAQGGRWRPIHEAKLKAWSRARARTLGN
jgi:hypothetical protein